MKGDTRDVEIDYYNRGMDNWPCLKQADFAKEIKLTQGHVSDIENKRKGVSDRVIEIICDRDILLRALLYSALECMEYSDPKTCAST